ncbi:ATP-binding protein [Abyssibius alkaniclasticus]|uniref:two-component system sensor histidine kinase NtrB n=1 Tax=Abyssibius alkaniclasticus TaxID=2881234 RepID=UPI0023641CCE|nr:ATP-binding protein [Abyssibius alkaniclasticus]UPH70640.1 ATP-binding protein [Abyssibius alkaniclasticus]
MSALDYEAIWGAMPSPAFVLDAQDTIIAANNAAEHFAQMSLRQIEGHVLTEFVGESSALADVLGQARRGALSVVRYDVEVTWADRSRALSNVQAAWLNDSGDLLVQIHPRGMADKMDRSLAHRAAARSVTAMAAMLGHEIRNPLAGISGAAQLLAMNLQGDDRELAELIDVETKRIGALVNMVEHFGDLRPATRTAVNVHDVLDRAKRAALAGYARNLRFVEDYDPSLPPVAAAADQLLQVIQNLLKNAAEAIGDNPGTITLRTAYRPGVKLALPGGRRESLPIELTIADTGPGIPDDLRDDIFDAFVTTKANGTGLGLSLVSKIIAEHGGVVECVTSPEGTKFLILLPVWRGKDGVK